MKIPKSRYDSVDLYISEGWMNRPEYNDNTLPIDEALYERMREHGERFVVFFFFIRVNWMQESMNYFPSTLRTYLFVILLLYFPSSLIKTTVRAQTISRSVFQICFVFFVRIGVDEYCTTRTSNRPIGRL